MQGIFAQTGVAKKGPQLPQNGRLRRKTSV